MFSLSSSPLSLSPLSSVLLISSISLQFIITAAIWLFLPHQFVLLVGSQQIDCDILNPRCQERYRQMMHATTLKSKVSQCSQKDIWLIPGKADASCCELFFIIS